MQNVVECVPNFSEGQNPDVLSTLGTAIESVSGVMLLDVHADRSHNRSVFTLVGEPGSVLEAAFRSVQAAVTRIDLRTHCGEHPRIGAADVVPFIPLANASMTTCVELAERLGNRLGTELGLPVFLYGDAARQPDRNLSELRRGGYEALGSRIRTDPALVPDFGPRQLHPTAGATAVGARSVLVAYNVFLDTEDVELARRIARSIRTSSGGLPALRAHGFAVGNRAQVSINLLDIDITPLRTAFESVSERARAAGVEVLKSEIVGLVPERALPGDAQATLKLGEPIEGRILERRIEELLAT